MARAIYIVLHSRHRWWVDFEGRAFGPFTSKEIARTEAISMARFMGSTGRQTEVRVPDETGRWWMEWESDPDHRWSRWKPGFRPLTDVAPVRQQPKQQVRIPGADAALPAAG
jgi:hypothetical protein